ncbi:MAG: hypothetical protein IIC50_15785 [Planctomycetes bacterium]|nr:hypothetical protein [Planctomycetota bacterium]
MGIQKSKLFLAGPKKGNVELFDIQQDSGETLNLAKDNPRVVERMTKQLRQWQASVEVSLTGADY